MSNAGDPKFVCNVAQPGVEAVYFSLHTALEPYRLQQPRGSDAVRSLTFQLPTGSSSFCPVLGQRLVLRTVGRTNKRGVQPVFSWRKLRQSRARRTTRGRSLRWIVTVQGLLCSGLIVSRLRVSDSHVCSQRSAMTEPTGFEQAMPSSTGLL
jgi:hypothetical protein